MVVRTGLFTYSLDYERINKPTTELIYLLMRLILMRVLMIKYRKNGECQVLK